MWFCVQECGLEMCDAFLMTIVHKMCERHRQGLKEFNEEQERNKGSKRKKPDEEDEGEEEGEEGTTPKKGAIKKHKTAAAAAKQSASSSSKAAPGSGSKKKATMFHTHAHLPPRARGVSMLLVPLLMRAVFMSCMSSCCMCSVK